ncbi:MAG: carboxylating nicotinate-nucleotide diphosphorylase [Alphaproteobacteria bacterium]
MNHMQQLNKLVVVALAEDIGQGDVTSAFTISENTTATMQIVARQELVVCGLDVLDAVFSCLGGNIKIHKTAKDGDTAQKCAVLAELQGNARVLLTGERTALNIMQRMSGVATLTLQYAKAVEGTKAVILDTRKTMPGMRALDKYAVFCGGGQNHRMRLDDMVLIKDNHIAVCGGIGKAVERARAQSNLPVEVECDTLEQVKDALAAKPDRIMLDNMTNAQLSEAVKMVAGAVALEASGGVNLQTVRAIAETGVDYISVGTITHSAPAVDIGADIVLH